MRKKLTFRLNPVDVSDVLCVICGRFGAELCFEIRSDYSSFGVHKKCIALKDKSHQ